MSRQRGYGPSCARAWKRATAPWAARTPRQQQAGAHPLMRRRKDLLDSLSKRNLAEYDLAVWSTGARRGRGCRCPATIYATDRRTGRRTE